MATLEDIDDDILYLVLEHLSTERRRILQCFGLVSWRLKGFADRVRFKVLVLEDDPLDETTSYEIIERLTDPLHPLPHCVRDFRVKSFQGDEASSCMNLNLIINCLVNIRKLDAFSWASHIPLSNEVLDSLSKHHPNAQLFATVQSFDEPLLASPQLHGLTCSVPCIDTTATETPSQFHRLKLALINAPNLRSLTLNTHPNPNTPDLPGTRTDPLHLPLSATDNLPSLTHLSIQSTTYALDELHCTRLLHSTNWRALTHLSLAISNPQPFFRAFTSQLPSLTTLELALHYACPDIFSTHPRHVLPLTAARDFIHALPALRAVTLLTNAVAIDHDFWYCLFMVHGQTLSHLRIQPRLDGLAAPHYKPGLHEHLGFFEALRTLHLSLPFHTHMHRCGPHCAAIGAHAPDTDYAAVIPVLRSLQRISLCVDAPALPSGKTLRGVVAAHAHCALRRLWRQYMRTETALGVVSVRFWCWRGEGPRGRECGGRACRVVEVVFESWRVGEYGFAVRVKGAKGETRYMVDEEGTEFRREMFG